jgi:hypothetical protein
MRRTGATKLLGVLTAATLLLAGCGSDDANRLDTDATDATDTSDRGDDSADAVAAAVGGARGQVLASALKSTHAGTARMAMSIDLGGFFGFDADGAIDFDSGDLAIRMDLTEMLEAFKGLASSLDGSGDHDAEFDDLLDGDLIFEIRQVDDRIYLRIPAALAEQSDLPDALEGAEWIAIDLDDALAASQLSESSLAALRDQADPKEFLKFLTAVSDDVHEAGTERIRGEITTHYVGTLDLTKAFDGLAQSVRDDLESQLGDVDDAFASLGQQFGLDALPFDVWVDGDGLLRKLEIRMDMSEMLRDSGADSSGFGGELSMTFELYDYGSDVNVQAPPPADVTVIDPSILDDTSDTVFNEGDSSLAG